MLVTSVKVFHAVPIEFLQHVILLIEVIAAVHMYGLMACACEGIGIDSTVVNYECG